MNMDMEQYKHICRMLMGLWVLCGISLSSCPYNCYRKKGPKEFGDVESSALPLCLELLKFIHMFKSVGGENQWCGRVQLIKVFPTEIINYSNIIFKHQITSVSVGIKSFTSDKQGLNFFLSSGRDQYLFCKLVLQG